MFLGRPRHLPILATERGLNMRCHTVGCCPRGVVVYHEALSMLRPGFKSRRGRLTGVNDYSCVTARVEIHTKSNDFVICHCTTYFAVDIYATKARSYSRNVNFRSASAFHLSLHVSPQWLPIDEFNGS